MSETSHVPFREVPYLPQKTMVEYRDDGSLLIRNGQPLKDYPPHMLWPLKYWAEQAPNRTWLAQRDPVDPSRDGWQEISYAEAWSRVQALAQGFLNAGDAAPVMILSRNTIDHALVMYGAMLAGCPVVPVTPAYALLSQDFARLNYVDKLVEPHYIYVEDGTEYQRGLDGMNLGQRLVLYSRNAPTDCQSQSIDAFAAAGGNSVSEAYDRLTPDTVAKYMLTSGSTGEPKAVINTQRMLCTNQEARALIWPFVEVEPPVILDWLPWNHTFGANHNFNLVLRNGGTLYIDDGKPVPELIDRTVDNLRAVSPTVYFNVPRGYDMLIDRMRELENELPENLKALLERAA